MKKQRSKCLGCGQEFSFYPSQSSGVFCSQECRKKSSRMFTNCPQCGKEFWYYQSWSRIYCSRECSATANVHRQLGVIRLDKQFCEVCGKEITQTKYRGRRFCSRKCFGEWKSKNVIGENHPSYERVELTCKQCGKIFKRAKHWLKRGYGIFCSRECQGKWQSENPPSHFPPVMYGEDNPRWSGGAFPYYYGQNWRPQRRNARKRDNYTCQKCGITEKELGKQLDVHHIVPFRQFGIEKYKEANSLSNLISLCNICHLTIEHQNGYRPKP